MISRGTALPRRSHFLGAFLLLSACSDAVEKEYGITTSLTTSTAESDPVEEFDQRFRACLEENGFTVSLDGEGVSSVDVPEDQDEVFLQIAAECRSEAGWRLLGPPTPEELGLAFDARIQVADCLEGLGYLVTDPPSRAAWIDSGGTMWDPYDNLIPGVSISEDEYDRISATCPNP